MTLKENSDLGKTIFDCCVELFERNCDFSVPYRSIGVSVSRLCTEKDTVQMSLLEENGDQERQKKEETALEEIRRRFGYRSVSTLRLLEDAELSGSEAGDAHALFPSSYVGR